MQRVDSTACRHADRLRRDEIGIEANAWVRRGARFTENAITTQASATDAENQTPPGHRAHLGPLSRKLEMAGVVYSSNAVSKGMRLPTPQSPHVNMQSLFKRSLVPAYQLACDRKQL